MGFTNQSNLSCLTWSCTCYSGSNSCYSSGILRILQLSACSNIQQPFLWHHAAQTNTSIPTCSIWMGLKKYPAGKQPLCYEGKNSCNRCVFFSDFLVSPWWLATSCLWSFSFLHNSSHLSMKKRRGTFINLCYQPRLRNGSSINTESVLITVRQRESYNHCRFACINSHFSICGSFKCGWQKVIHNAGGQAANPERSHNKNMMDLQIINGQTGTELMPSMWPQWRAQHTLQPQSCETSKIKWLFMWQIYFGGC